jgi:hypothetical protein
VSRGLSFTVAALQALIIAMVGLGLIVGPLTLVWLFESNGSLPWLLAVQVAAYAWLLAHGVTLDVAPGELVGIEFDSFAISALPLGLTVLAATMIIRIGHRLSAAPSIWPGWVGGALAYGGVGFALSALVAGNPAITFEQWQAVLYPAVIFAGLLLLASVFGRRFELFRGANGPEAGERVALRALASRLRQSLHWSIATVLSPAARAGFAVVAMLAATSALMLALALGFGWIEVIRLYEGLRVSVLGGLVITLGQLAILPNLVVYGMSFISGTGFAIGLGSSVSPIATQLGPLPALPIFAAIPTGGFDRALIFTLVPIVGAFIATLLARRHTDEMRWEYATRFSAALAFALTAAFFAATAVALLGLLATGSFGPGRLQFVGVDVLMWSALTFVQVAVPSFMAGLVVIKPYADASQRRL